MSLPEERIEINKIKSPKPSSPAQRTLPLYGLSHFFVTAFLQII